MTESNEKLTCSVCGLPKLKDEFHPDPRRKRGVTSACKECMRDNKARAGYVKTGQTEGVEALYQLREKHERALTILKEVIEEFEHK